MQWKRICQRKIQYYSYTLILVKSYLIQLKSYLILDILSESISVNLGIKAKKILGDCYVLHVCFNSKVQKLYNTNKSQLYGNQKIKKKKRKN